MLKNINLWLLALKINSVKKEILASNSHQVFCDTLLNITKVGEKKYPIDSCQACNTWGAEGGGGITCANLAYVLSCSQIEDDDANIKGYISKYIYIN